MKIFLVVAAFILLIASEVLRVYYIMPFPGSQVNDTISFAYFLNSNMVVIRLVGWVLLLYSLFSIWGSVSLSLKIITGIVFTFYLFILILFNFYFVADKIFYQPNTKIFLKSAENKVDLRKLIIGVNRNGEAKAYPIEIIGYHHQVRDTVGGEPLMITYCTVCRTGRVFSPIVDGKPEVFRLVGMDHFNAMFEDQTTKSWWRQVNGEAIIGPRKGQQLTEVPSSQMALGIWLEQYPDTKIMQPDSAFKQGYADLEQFDEGTLPSGLEKRDTLSWKNKSWIVGVQVGTKARAYNWNDLTKQRVINDTLNEVPLAIILENDSVSFHVYKRDSLQLTFDLQRNQLIDRNTGSLWGWNGICNGGPLAGRKLSVIQSYQEFWHSWKTFRPQTTRFGGDEKK